MRLNNLLFLVVFFLIHRATGGLGENDSDYSTKEYAAAIKFIHEQNWLYSLRQGMPNVTDKVRDTVLAGETERAEKLLLQKLPSSDEACSLARLALIKGHVATAKSIVQLFFQISEFDLTKVPANSPRNLLLLLDDLSTVQTIFAIMDADPAAIFSLDSNGGTAMHSAAKDEKWFIVDVLLERQMQSKAPYRNVVDKDGLSTFHILSAGMNWEFVEQFLENASHKVDIDQAVAATSKFRPGYTALHFAAERCRTDSLKILLKLGAHVNAMDANGRRALHVSCRPWWSTVDAKAIDWLSDLQFRDINDTVVRRFFGAHDEL